MPRNYTSLELSTRLREMTDTENDTHLGQAELYRILTSAVARTWDSIIKAGIGSEYVKTVTFNTTPNVTNIATSTIVPAGDFYRVSKMFVDEGSGQYRPIERLNPAMIQAYRPPTNVVPMRLDYIPCAPVWTLGSEVFDGINGWEELVLAIAAITIKEKKQDDCSTFKATKREMEAQIATMANRFDGDPPRVVRKRRAESQDMYAPWRNNVSAYDIRGLNFAFYYRYGFSL